MRKNEDDTVKHEDKKGEIEESRMPNDPVNSQPGEKVADASAQHKSAGCPHQQSWYEDAIKINFLVHVLLKPPL
jgi:hypothetical protein